MKKKIKKIGVGVNVFIFNKEGKILLGKRKGLVGNNEWCLPGGKLEFGEKLTEGAIRETYEETGIKISAIKFINVTNDPRKLLKEHYIHFNFKTKSSRQPKLMEPNSFSAWGWFYLNDLPSPIFYGHKKLISGFKKNQIITD